MELASTPKGDQEHRRYKPPHNGEQSVAKKRPGATDSDAEMALDIEKKRCLEAEI